MTQTAFDPSYTAVTKDGAEWIVKRGDIRLVGIDYISVAHYADLIGPHIALLTDVSPCKQANFLCTLPHVLQGA